ncbi:MAG TPA: hypothetical protein VHI51_16070 [Ktedonobacterales bacterium]|jgi:hypothetical protein|nr:hypothetical protein [Ktedonobacterales bacterium]
MKTSQPPIANDQELAGYRAGADRLRAMIERHEMDLLAERQRVPADLRHLDQIRYQLHHLYGYYKGIQGAIDAYLQRLNLPSSPRRVVRLPGVL